jgi:hypothetical protein
MDIVDEKALAELRNEILAELREVRRLVETPPPHGDDLVTASYIAARTGLKERTILEGKAGTKEIPRVLLKEEHARRPVVRFQRAAVDRWIRGKIVEANENDPRQRALRFDQRRRRKSA